MFSQPTINVFQPLSSCFFDLLLTPESMLFWCFLNPRVNLFSKPESMLSYFLNPWVDMLYLFFRPSSWYLVIILDLLSWWCPYFWPPSKCHCFYLFQPPSSCHFILMFLQPPSWFVILICSRPLSRYCIYFLNPWVGMLLPQWVFHHFHAFCFPWIIVTIYLHHFPHVLLLFYNSS